MCISLSYDSAVRINYYTTDCISDTYKRSVKIEAGKILYIHTYIFQAHNEMKRHTNIRILMLIL